MGCFDCQCHVLTWPSLHKGYLDTCPLNTFCSSTLSNWIFGSVAKSNILHGRKNKIDGLIPWIHIIFQTIHHRMVMLSWFCRLSMSLSVFFLFFGSLVYLFIVCILMNLILNHKVNFIASSLGFDIIDEFSRVKKQALFKLP